MPNNEEDLFSNDDATFCDSLSSTSIEIPSFFKTPIKKKNQPSQYTEPLTVKKSNNQANNINEFLSPKSVLINESNIAKEIESLNDSFGAINVENSSVKSLENCKQSFNNFIHTDNREYNNSVENKISIVENWLASIPKSPEPIQNFESFEEVENQTEALKPEESSEDLNIFSSDEEGDDESESVHEFPFDIPNPEQYEEEIKKLQMNNPDYEAKSNFIYSLLNDFDNKYRDPEAHRFRINYKYWKLELAQRIFKIYNEFVFNNLLSSDTKISFNPRFTKTGGICKYERDEEGQMIFEIQISSKIAIDSQRLLEVMIHEMCHGAGIISKIFDKHGPVWRMWCIRAQMVFPLVPLSTQYHYYEAKFKYKYYCQTCEFVKPKHSKMKVIQNCKKCGGNLIKFSDGGYGVYLKVDMNKPLTGFAAFVKENYKNARSEGTDHKQAMKILSEQFHVQKLELEVNKAKTFMKDQSKILTCQ